MNELLLPGLFVAVMAAIAAAAIGMRAAAVEQRLRALSRVEGKLDALLKHQGIRYDPYGEVPQPVLDAVRSGRKIEAIKAYRAATGAGLAQAKEYVEEVQRRASAKI
jgi:ribosomal protein L7/L12